MYNHDRMIPVFTFKLSAADRMAEGEIYCENYDNILLQGTVATTYKTAGFLWVGATAHRIQVYELEFGQTAGLSSTDCQCEWDVSRFSLTAIMTASTVASNLLDPADVVASSVFANNATGELTYTTAGAGLNLKHWAINQRGSYRWRALDDGDNVLVAATAQNGIGVRVLSSNFTGSAVGGISWVER